MKHGDKNAKTAKAAGQASGKKSSSKTAGETTKSGKSPKEAGKEVRKAVDAGKKQQAGPVAKEGIPAKAGAKAAKVASVKAGSSKAGSVKEAAPAPAAPARRSEVRDKIDFRPREDGGFTNAVVGNAFKRVVKKYPNAFRRLTD